MRRRGANQMMASTPNAQRLTSSVQFKTRRVNLLKHDLEELNALPFSRYVEPLAEPLPGLPGVVKAAAVWPLLSPVVVARAAP